MKTDFFYRAEEIVIQRDWACFPVSRSTKTPCIIGGRNAASKDMDQITKWSEDFPYANVGVATGVENGIFVVDIDDALAFEHLKSLGKMPSTLTASSGRGFHLYYQHIGGKVVNRAGKLVLRSKNPWRGDDWLEVQGLDIRGDGGSIIAPPSVHSSGRSYFWQDGYDKVSLPPLWLCRMIGEKHEAKKKPQYRFENAPPPLRTSIEMILNSQSGNRNATLNSAAFLARKGVMAGSFTRAQAEQELMNAAISIGLSKQEAVATIKSGLY